MDMTPQEYQEYVKRLAPKSPIFKDTAFAFFIGGAICALGQLIQNGFLSLGLAKADAGTATSICLIFLSALLTGLNLYNSIARFAGAGHRVRHARKRRVRRYPDAAVKKERYRGISPF